MMAKINHFRNEAHDETNDHFHLTPSRLFGIDMKIVRHSGRSFVFKICIPPIPNEIVCSLQFDQLIDQSLITSLRDVSAKVEFSRLA